MKLALFIFVLLAGAAMAQNCVTPDVQTAKQDATYIFSGRLTEITDPSFGEVRAFFTAEKVFKGDAYNKFDIYFQSQYYSYPFQEGQKYLVYATGTKDRLFVDVCSRTKLLSDAMSEGELDMMGAGLVPYIENPHSTAGNAIQVIIGVFSVFILLLLFMAMGKEKKANSYV